MRKTALAALVLVTPAAALGGPFALEGSRRPGSVRAMAAAPDGTVLVSDGNAIVRLDPSTRVVVRTYTLPPPDDEAFIEGIAAVGNDLLVGVPYSHTATEQAAFGAAYLLDGASGAVRQAFTSPVPPQSPSGNLFGSSVAALGGDVLVGAPLERAAYRFDAVTGALEQTYPDPGPGMQQFGSTFGSTVLALGDAVIVAAPVDRAVHVFDADTGALRRTIVDPRPESLPYSFGAALAVLGSDLLVGGPPSASGEAAVWLFDAATGELLRAFTSPNDPIEYSDFGRSVAVGDGRVVVGDPGFGVGRVDGDYDADPSVGAAYVFDAATGLLLQTISNPTPISPDEYEDERFGAALAAVPGRVLVSDPSDQTLSSLEGGGLYVYVDTTGCGDGALGPLEVCDDGNLVDGDGCDSNCRPTACGNGVTSAGEVCDDGNLVDGDGCDSNCRPTACGNGAVSDGEQCDDGNVVEGDGCSDRCTIEVCGNGILDPTEACDDGNLTDGDACSAGCRVEPRDHFTCYRARGARGERSLVLADAYGERPAVAGRPIAFCQGDALTAPSAELTCYRLKHVRGGRRFPHRAVTVADGAGETLLRTSRSRTVCLPSDGSRVFRLARTFTDPVAPADSGFGFGLAGVDGRVVIGSPFDVSAASGTTFVFDGASGAFERPLCCGFRFFGLDVADAGGGQVLVATVDDESYLYDPRTGARLRRFVGPGPRTPVADRPIAAVGPYVLSGDPNNHSSGFSWAGAVHVFDRATGVRLHTLYGPDPAAFRGFGEAVAALGGQALIAQSDRVYLYDPATWTPVREFARTTLGAEAVAGIGRHVLIGTPWYGAPGEAALLDADTGAVVRTLHDDPGAPNDRFGEAIDSAGAAFVVGAPGTPRLLPAAGAVHVIDAMTGERRNTILNPEPTRPGFGMRVAAMGQDLLVASAVEFGSAPGAVSQFSGGPLDWFTCYDARAANGPAGFAPVERWIADAERAGSVRLDRPVSECVPSARDGGTIAHPDMRLACYAVSGGAAPDRQVTVHNAFGSETLGVSARRLVCLDGAHTELP